MKKNIFLFAAVALVLGIFGAITVYKNITFTPLSKNNNVNTEITDTEDKKDNPVSLTIRYSPEDIKTYSIEYAEGMTAYIVLDTIAKKENITIAAKNYANDIFVDAIGEKKGGDENKYWLYYINGKSPSISADKQRIQPGDTIEFKFENSPF